jgi:predicted RNase H-like nuclease (RuvC/YqgF family)
MVLEPTCIGSIYGPHPHYSRPYMLSYEEMVKKIRKLEEENKHLCEIIDDMVDTIQKLKECPEDA